MVPYVRQLGDDDEAMLCHYVVLFFESIHYTRKRSYVMPSSPQWTNGDIGTAMSRHNGPSGTSPANGYAHWVLLLLTRGVFMGMWWFGLTAGVAEEFEPHKWKRDESLACVCVWQTNDGFFPIFYSWHTTADRMYRILFKLKRDYNNRNGD